jgi:hypothetical protein
VVFYLIPTTALLWSISRWPGSRWPAVVLAGAVYGFVTEGVLTVVVYGGFPFDPFAISYTSLAWHAVVTVWFGLVLLHRLLASGPTVRAVAGIALFGVFWGLWAMTLRLPSGDDELPALSMLVGDVELRVFAAYTAAATVAIGVCHLLLGRFVRPADLVVGRGWRMMVLVVGLLWFAFFVVPAAPWAPVELVVLLLLCAWGLARHSRVASPGPTLAAVICEPIRPPRLGMLTALPVAAILTQGVLLRIDPSEHAIRSYLLEPMVDAQTLLGWALFIAALASVRRASSPVIPARP